MGQATIAVTASTEKSGAFALAALLKRSLDIEPRFEVMDGLAGPNDTIQLLLDLPAWVQILGSGAGIYLTGVLSQAGADTWSGLRMIFRKPPPQTPILAGFVDEFSWLATYAQKNGNTVIVGFPVDTKRVHFRHLGIELPQGFTKQDLHRSFAVLVNVGDDLNSVIEENIRKGANVRPSIENSDRSGAIKVNPDGSVEIGLIIQEQDGTIARQITIKYDLNGRRE